MNNTERLQAIRAKCIELLEIASRRTPGEWEAEGTTVWGHDPERESSSICDTVSRADFSDATFIASCAGPAEAGWRATIAAIDSLSQIATEKELVEHGYCGDSDSPYVSHMRTGAAIFASTQLQQILAAWKDINLEGGAK